MFISPQNSCWNPRLQCRVFGVKSVREVIRSGRWHPQELHCCSYKKETPRQLPLPCSLCEEKRTRHLATQKRDLTTTSAGWHHDLTLPGVVRELSWVRWLASMSPLPGKGEGVSPRQLTRSQHTEWFCADFLSAGLLDLSRWAWSSLGSQPTAVLSFLSKACTDIIKISAPFYPSGWRMLSEN